MSVPFQIKQLFLFSTSRLISIFTNEGFALLWFVSKEQEPDSHYFLSLFPPYFHRNFIHPHHFSLIFMKTSPVSLLAHVSVISAFSPGWGFLSCFKTYCFHNILKLSDVLCFPVVLVIVIPMCHPFQSSWMFESGS